MASTSAPYEPDGGYSAGALLACLGLMAAAALGVGYGAHFPDTWLPEIEYVWTLAMGFALALLGWLVIGWTKIRSVKAAGLSGLAAGFMVILAMHYWNYRERLATLEEDVGRQLPAQVALEELGKNQPRPNPLVQRLRLNAGLSGHAIPPKIVAEVDPVIRAQIKAGKLKQAVLLQVMLNALPQGQGRQAVDLGPEVNEAITVAISHFGFFDYIDWKATEGAPLELPKVRARLNLGYAGSYILWAVEALIAGLIAAGFMVNRSTHPFCLECGRWKVRRELGRLALPGELAKQLFLAGAVMELADQEFTRKEGALRVQVSACPVCGPESPVEVRLVEVAANARGKEETSELAHLTYPGEALRVLEALFAQQAAAPAREPPQPTATDDANG